LADIFRLIGLRVLLGRSFWFRKPEFDTVICIYTCKRHSELLEEFHKSVIGNYLLNLPYSKILEVYADPSISRSFHRGNRLILRTPERYEALSLKTFKMIQYCVQRFEFQRLLKIDVTTVMNTFEGTEYEGRKAIDPVKLVHFLQESSPEKHYDGFLLHARASREDAETWAAKKGGKIDYERLFSDGPMPPWFSGKSYFVSQEFARFIGEHGARMAREHVEYFIGAEDLMIGRLFEEFQKSSL